MSKIDFWPFLSCSFELDWDILKISLSLNLVPFHQKSPGHVKNALEWQSRFLPKLQSYEWIRILSKLLTLNMNVCK
jgi:hypothetical protein